jgi:fucose permease
MEGTPRLIENGARSYMCEILNKCHENRINIYLYFLNIGVFLFFLFIGSLVLYYCYKSKLTPEEEYQKKIKEQEYILSKIRFYKEHQRNITSKASITELPILDGRIL